MHEVQRVLALCYFWDLEKNRISQILVIVLKNRSNEIRNNEIRIRRELPRSSDLPTALDEYCLTMSGLNASETVCKNGAIYGKSASHTTQ